MSSITLRPAESGESQPKEADAKSALDRPDSVEAQIEGIGNWVLDRRSGRVSTSTETSRSAAGDSSKKGFDSNTIEEEFLTSPEEFTSSTDLSKERKIELFKSMILPRGGSSSQPKLRFVASRQMSLVTFGKPRYISLSGIPYVSLSLGKASNHIPSTSYRKCAASEKFADGGERRKGRNEIAIPGSGLLQKERRAATSAAQAFQQYQIRLYGKSRCEEREGGAQSQIKEEDRSSAGRSAAQFPARS
ncbi:UNVERIFIED_CONTAM: hypothetical protein Scaly_2802300 [Sesamum calycinum]|uniref:Uncharacterized protein n=1 Tax=Sesamum calycinum TaxID=2727403 RepID=A0AAW2IVD5_9LAMI